MRKNGNVNKNENWARCQIKTCVRLLKLRSFFDEVAFKLDTLFPTSNLLLHAFFKNSEVLSTNSRLDCALDFLNRLEMDTLDIPLEV